MSGRTAGRDDGVQNPAGALGQRPDPDREKNPAAGAAQRRAAAHKIEAWYHLTANISYPLMIMLSVLLLPAMIIRFYQGWFQMLLHRPAAVSWRRHFPFPVSTWFRRGSSFLRVGRARCFICHS